MTGVNRLPGTTWKACFLGVFLGTAIVGSLGQSSTVESQPAAQVDPTVRELAQQVRELRAAIDDMRTEAAAYRAETAEHPEQVEGNSETRQDHRDQVEQDESSRGEPARGECPEQPRPDTDHGQGCDETADRRDPVRNQQVTARQLPLEGVTGREPDPQTAVRHCPHHDRSLHAASLLSSGDDRITRAKKRPPPSA